MKVGFENVKKSLVTANYNMAALHKNQRAKKYPKVEVAALANRHEHVCYALGSSKELTRCQCQWKYSRKA
jgi:hypothetical protein